MKQFTTWVGMVVPLDRANVDTDQIIPKQFLKSIRRTGFGENLFDAWRFLDEGSMGQTPNERKINREFVLNQPRYQGASVLLARANFGCGSSREHAVWALDEYGIRCVIAPSFADIFFNNCFKNGLLPIVLNEKIVDRMFTEIAEIADGRGYAVTIDLPSQTVQLPDGSRVAFAIEANRKECLMSGLDEIGITLQSADAIRAYESKQRERRPWLFDAKR